MIYRKLRYASGWEWHFIQNRSLDGETDRDMPLPPSRSARKQKPAAKTDEQGGAPPGSEAAAALAEQRSREAEQLGGELGFCKAWLRETADRTFNQISFSLDEDSQPVLSGTLMVQPTELDFELQPIHFWLSGSRLVTWHENARLPLRLQTGAWSSTLETCTSAREAFLVLLGALLEVFHSGLDEYERKLTELEREMRSSNKTALLPVIFERRHELLHWTHQFLPIREIQDSAKEAFMDELIDTPAFQRLSYKLERIDTLLTRYTAEMDTLIAMDDAIASFRGNDIMKTLTIFTALSVPPTIAGSLWGVNFNYLPGTNSRFGFAILCVAIALFAACLYTWLWYKGWTGDLLTDRVSSRSTKRKNRKQSGRGSAGAAVNQARFPQGSRVNGAAAGSHAEAAPLSRMRGKTKRKPSKASGKSSGGSRSSRPYPGQDGTGPGSGEH
ncbi:magnesium transporter CorA family protein [Paenibacillus pasadenensis]|uniref:magnesium transporter CorA family protein n=1 Tax=Paenibacillus pasadenensis TaxID=217090 RepID=UPI00203B5445|nr:magnesium transporter CorA family protein [Paenibacillus pasadenensis]MCM3748328.1 magnesium transporter CorA family protein [Paenibacillus pasadenensis]